MNAHHRHGSGSIVTRKELEEGLSWARRERERAERAARLSRSAQDAWERGQAMYESRRARIASSALCSAPAHGTLVYAPSAKRIVELFEQAFEQGEAGVRVARVRYR